MDPDQLRAMLREAEEAREQGLDKALLDSYIAEETDGAHASLEALRMAVGVEESKGRARSIFQGLTLGFGDEAEALAGAMANPLKSYEERIEPIRQSIESHRREAGVLPTIAEEVVGGLPLGMARVMQVPKGLGLLGQMKAGARIGAATGAAYGVGTGESLTGRAAGGVVGGAAGGLVGGVAPAIAEGVRGAAGSLKTVLGQSDEYAQRVLGREIGRSGGPQQLMQQLDPGDMLADQSESLRRLGRAAQAVPHEEINPVEEAVMTRAMAAGPQAQDLITRTTGVADDNVVQAGHQLAGALRTNARELYDAAYAVGSVDDARLTDLLNRIAAPVPGSEAARRMPSTSDLVAREAWEEAVALARDQGIDITQFVDLSGGQRSWTPTVRVLDYFKQALDARVQPALSRGLGANTGLTQKRAYSLKTNILDPMLEILDDVVPEYKAARAQYAGDLEALNALEAGRQAINRTGREIADEITGMDPASSQMYRLGYVDALRRKYVDKTTGGITLTRRLMGAEDQMRALFPTQSVSEFMEGVHVLMNQNRTRNMVMGGSPTARIQEDVAGFFGRPDRGVARNIAEGRGREALGFATARLGAEASGVGRKNVAAEVARDLFLRDPSDVLSRYLARGPQLQQDALRETQRRMLGSFYGGLGGGQATRLFRR